VDVHLGVALAGLEDERRDVALGVAGAEEDQREDHHAAAAGGGQPVEDGAGGRIGHLQESDVDHHVGQRCANQAG